MFSGEAFKQAQVGINAFRKTIQLVFTHLYLVKDSDVPDLGKAFTLIDQSVYNAYFAAQESIRELEGKLYNFHGKVKENLKTKIEVLKNTSTDYLIKVGKDYADCKAFLPKLKGNEKGALTEFKKQVKKSKEKSSEEWNEVKATLMDVKLGLLKLLNIGNFYYMTFVNFKSVTLYQIGKMPIG